MKVIAVVNQKGGCGKTTTCINLADQFVRKSKRVLVVDLDPQANLSLVLAYGEHSHTTADVFDKSSSVKLSEALVSTEIKGLSICTSELRLSRVIEQSMSTINRERILIKELERIKDEYDIVILDCPPNLSLTTINAMMAADLFLTPVDRGFSLSGVDDMFDTLIEVRETEDLNFWVFRNEYSARNRIVNKYIDEQLYSIKPYLLKTKIRAAEAVEQANISGSSLSHYQKNSIVNNDYRALANELLEKLEAC